MANSDIKNLLQVEYKSTAEEIRRILEESDVFCLFHSHNPASSFLHAYFGVTAQDHITIQVTEEDYQKAYTILEQHGYIGTIV